MRTNGLVVSFVLALAVVGHRQAAAQTPPASAIETGYVTAAGEGGADQSASCCLDSSSEGCSGGWFDFLIGSPCACHLFAGTEFTRYDVESQTGGRTTLSFSDTTAPGIATVSFNDPGGVEDEGYAPRVWLGAQLTDKWAVRGRYWRLSDSDQHVPELAPGTTPTGTEFATIFTTDRVEAWTADLEAVRCADWGLWKVEGFVGGRQARFETDSDLLAFGVFTTGNFVNLTLQNACSFEGEGITYGGTLRRQIGRSNLYAFGGVRGSELYGHSNSMGRSDGTVASSPSAPLVGAATVARNGAEAVMGIFETQLGLELECPLQDVPANFFFRVAYEYQNWDIDGPPTGGAGFGGTIGELTTNSFARAGLGGMVLHGISIGTGLTW
jgi:hypothetical protein